MNTEIEIITAYHKGSYKAFEVIYKRCHTLVYLTSLKYVHDEYDAKDVRSACFMKLWEARDTLKFHNMGEVATWLSLTSRNKSIDMLRMKSAHLAKEDIILNKQLSYYDNEVFELSDKEAAIINRLMTKIEQLPPRLKDVFKLRWLDNLKFKEIAQVLNADLSTTKKRYARAVELLRKDIGRFIGLFLIV